MQVGERILKLRKENNISQEELGFKINVSRQTISKWENNETSPDLNNLKSLAKIFNVSTDYLINGNKQLVRKTKVQDYIVLIVGISFLFLTMIILIINPKGSNETSSMIEFSIRGLLITISIIIILIGLYFAYKKRNEK
jgi:transcriptional regulator with XRE-family HTH domain